MCDPVTLAATTMAASAIGGGVSALGKIGEGKAQSASYQYQAQLARQNAAVAAANAESEKVAGDKAQGQQQVKVGQFLGQQRANIAANNIDLNSGSAANVQRDTRTLGQADVENIRDEYYNRIRNDVAQQNSFNAESSMDVAAGKNAKTAGYMGAASSLLTSAASVGSKWAGYQQAGVFN